MSCCIFHANTTFWIRLCSHNSRIHSKLYATQLNTSLLYVSGHRNKLDPEGTVGPSSSIPEPPYVWILYAPLSCACNSAHQPAVLVMSHRPTQNNWVHSRQQLFKPSRATLNRAASSPGSVENPSVDCGRADEPCRLHHCCKIYSLRV